MAVEQSSAFWLATDDQDLEAINTYMHVQPLNNADATNLFNQWVTWYDALGFLDKTVNSSSTYDLARNMRDEFNLANAETPEAKAQVQAAMKTGQSSEQDAGQTDRRNAQGFQPGPTAPQAPPLVPTYMKILIGLGVFIGAMVGINAVSSAATTAAIKKL